MISGIIHSATSNIESNTVSETFARPRRIQENNIQMAVKLISV
jgi:hypothetical protein